MPVLTAFIPAAVAPTCQHLRSLEGVLKVALIALISKLVATVHARASEPVYHAARTLARFVGVAG